MKEKREVRTINRSDGKKSLMKMIGFLKGLISVAVLNTLVKASFSSFGAISGFRESNR